MTIEITDSAVMFFYDHAGYNYQPRTETHEEGRERCARALAAAEVAYHADDDVFVVWEVDDIGSHDGFDDVDRSDCDPYPFYCALLCVDCDASEAQITRGYDPSDGIFERPGRVIGSLGAIDLGEHGHPSSDPYARVIVAEMYAELQSTREAVLVRGEN